MDYNRIMLEMLDRIKQLEERVNKLENRKETSPQKASNKYRHLTAHLKKNNSPVRLTFTEIEKILGFKLPASAYQYREFWSNTKSHSIALSWLCIGYKTVEVDIDNEFVIFEN